jgi:RimJ/RimL family protein N-acetyltransferase
VVLDPLRRDHLDPLFEAARRPEIWEFWPFNPAADRRRFGEWLDDVLRAVASGTEARFVTLEAGNERPIGSTSFCTLRPEHRGLEIGWTWLTPSAWGTGANAEAKLLQLRYAFSQLGCRRVEFETDELNIRSRRALEALPAQFEGVLRDLKLLPDGRRRSSAIYAILACDWPAVEERLKHRVREALRRR